MNKLLSAKEPRARVLIVEDERLVARDLSNTLTDLGYVVVASLASGEEALRRVASLGPELILMDIHLAGELDGVQTAEKIGSDHHIPVVYLTAHSDEETLQRAKLTGPFGYLIKPFKAAELRCTLETALYRHRLELDTRERLQTQTLTDDLTGLANRRGLMTRLSQLIKEARRGREFTLVMLDVDHFKSVNDSLGHPVGDQVLVAVAATISQQLRNVDFAARYGGDEFCLLLVDTTAQVKVALERLRMSLAGFPQAIRITASLGGCSYRPEFGADAEALLAAADKALYRAKQKGRNCVEFDE